MLLSDIQPQYFPRSHYFARMLASDIFVIRDEVQFVRTHKYPDGSRGVSYQAHTPIRTAQGISLLAVNLCKSSGIPINKTLVSYDQAWNRKHLNVIKNNYQKSPNAKLVLPELEALLEKSYTTLADLTIATMLWSLGHILAIAIREPIAPTLAMINTVLTDFPKIKLRNLALGSEIDCLTVTDEREQSATQRIVELCKHHRAKAYMAGGTAFKTYMNIELFAQNKIELTIQDWSATPYTQLFLVKQPFAPNLSIIDVLMNLPQRQIVSYLLGDVTTNNSSKA